MNSYEQKMAAKKERAEKRAAAARAKSAALNNQARKMAEVIPFGQPILVGHHSEKRDRNYRGRIRNKFQAAYEEAKKAEELEDKANSIGTGGISSDDPEAVQKLKEKLAKCERLQETMKKANAIIRKRKDDETCVTQLVEQAGLSEAKARELLTPDYMRRLGFPSFSLSNNNAEIRRIKERIATLEREAQRAPAEPIETEGGITVTEEDNRVCIRFPGKPAKEIRQLLRYRYGFVWAPSMTAWVRKLNDSARYAAKEFLQNV